MAVEPTLLEFSNQNNNTLKAVEYSSSRHHDFGVIFLADLFGSSLSTHHFELISSELNKQNIAHLLFDYSGHGISDGDINNLNYNTLVSDFETAYELFMQRNELSYITVVAEGFGSVVVTSSRFLENIQNIILFSPSLNQKDLLKFWFVQSTHPKKNITWDNYLEHFELPSFIDHYNQEVISTHNHLIPKQFFSHLIDHDFTIQVEPKDEHILHIHNGNNNHIPLESVSFNFSHRIVINSEHTGFSHPEITPQWLGSVIEFIQHPFT